MKSSRAKDAITADAPISAVAPEARLNPYLVPAVLAQLKEGVIITDATGVIVFVNEAASQLHGVARLDVAPEDYAATYHLFTEDGEPHPIENLPLTRAVVRGETVVGQRWRIRRPDGVEVLAIGDATPVRDSSGAQIGAVLTIRDDTRRYADEQRLKQSEERLQQIMNQLFVFVGLLDPKGVVLSANQAPLDIAGLTIDDVRGKRFEDAYWWSYDPAAQQRIRDAIDSAARGERVRFVAPVRAGDGRLARVDFQIAPIFDSDGRVSALVPSGVAIEDRLSVEEELRDSEIRFHTMADNIAQLAWMTRADGHIFWYNKRWFDYTGSTPEAMLGWGWRDVHHPDHVDRVVARFKQSIESGEPWEDTFPLRGADGLYRWFLSRALPIRNEAGDIVMWFGTNTDVTELRDAEDALRLSEAQFRGAFENAAVGVAHAAFDGRWLMVNDRLCELTGYKREVLMQLDVDAVTHPDDRAAAQEGRATIAGGGAKTYTLDKRFVRADGTVIWVSETASAQLGADGRPLHAILVIEDITLRRDAIEHQKFLLRELSHRTKNLLAVIQSIARQTGLNSASADDFNKRFMRRLAALASAHDLLVNEEWAGVRLDQLIREQVKAFLQHDGQLVLSGPALSVTPTTAQALSLALHELASNAAKFGALSVAEGRVLVGWGFDRSEKAERPFRLSWLERNGPPVAQPSRRGFGHIVIDQVAASSLLGASKLTFAPAGLQWEIEAPAASLSVEPKQQRETPAQ